jgi:hypothetical protein
VPWRLFAGAAAVPWRLFAGAAAVPWRLFAGAAAVAWLLLAGAASAYVPSASTIGQEVARANRRAGRAHSLVLSVALRSEDGGTIARGELLSDPGGVARLELSGSDGRVERHLLRGGEHLAASGGGLLAQPAPYLPPLFLLQVASGGRLLAALASLGGSADETALGRQDEQICYVLGGRDLRPAANESAAQFGSSGRKAAVWVVRDDFRVVRIDRLDGSGYLFGPEQAFGGVTLPQWIRIERPGVPTTRLEILAARQDRFDLPVTFGMDWLLGR